jgi:hypothetical protein
MRPRRTEEIKMLRLMMANIGKVALTMTFGLIVGLSSPAMAGQWNGQLYFGGYTNCGYFGCLPSASTPIPNPNSSGYHPGDVFGSQTGSESAGGNTGWNGCGTCSKLPQRKAPQPVIGKFRAHGA